VPAERPLRVALLSWEYPPLVVGGLAAHVHGLARAHAREGHDVVVLTLHHPDAPDDSVVDGVRVLRARTELPSLPHEGLLGRMSSANHQLVGLTSALGRWRADVVHSHDWLVAWAGDTLRRLWNAPLVATVHATELGRHQGHLPTGQPEAVASVEWWLTYQARRVVTCSQSMQAEVHTAFQLPLDKIDVIPNGVDASVWLPPKPPPVRGADGPVVVTWGRLQYEKGFQTLIACLAGLRRKVPGATLVIAGTGTFGEDLRRLATDHGVADAVRFAGFVPDAELRGLLHRASAVAIPSLYEPFGIVALEALAAGAPLVATRTGGLAEILGDGKAAVLVEPGDPVAAADALAQVLAGGSEVKRMSVAGARLVKDRYGWDAIAASTRDTYRDAGASSRVPQPRSTAPKRSSRARTTE
jgi:glycogen synthase